MGTMGTAVLRETDVLSGEEDIDVDADDVLLNGKQIPYDGTGIVVGGEEWSKMSLIARAGHLLWLDGNEVYTAYNEDEGFDFRKYIDAKTLKYLDAMTLDENWRDGQG